MNSRPSCLRFSLVQALFGATLALAESQRKLEQERDGGGDDDQGDDNFQVLYDAGERIEGDFESMWQTSPSEWITEYWEVFAATVFIIFFVIFCFCMECCSCCLAAKEPRRRVAATSQVEEEKKAWIARQQAKQVADQALRNSSPRSFSPKGGSSWNFFGFGSSGGKEAVSRSVPSPSAQASAVQTQAQNKKTRSTSEVVGKTLDLVVDLWSEFLFGKDNSRNRRNLSPRRRRNKSNRIDGSEEDVGGHYTAYNDLSSNNVV